LDRSQLFRHRRFARIGPTRDTTESVAADLPERAPPGWKKSIQHGLKQLLDDYRTIGLVEQLVDSSRTELPVPRLTGFDAGMLIVERIPTTLVRAAVLGPEQAHDLNALVKDTLPRACHGCAPSPQFRPNALHELLRAEAAHKRDASDLQIVRLLLEGHSGSAFNLLQERSSPTAQDDLLLAVALFEQGFRVLPREVSLQVVRTAVQENLGAMVTPALAVMTSATRMAGISPNAVPLASELCRGTVGEHPVQPLCYAAAHRELESGGMDLAKAYIGRFVDSRAGAGELDLSALVNVLENGTAKVDGYVEALGAAIDEGGLQDALVQRAALQLARAAYEFGEVTVVSKAMELLLPDTQLQDIVFSLQAAAGAMAYYRVEDLVACGLANRQDLARLPELPLSLAFSYSGRCCFAGGLDALALANAQLAKHDEIARTLYSKMPQLSVGPAGTWSRLQVVDQVLSEAGYSSEEVPSLDAVLKPAAQCGRWALAQSERLRVQRSGALSKAMKSRLLSLLDDVLSTESLVCSNALETAVSDYLDRVHYLRALAIILRDDLLAAATENWEAALMVSNKTHRQGRTLFCEDMAQWVSGKDPNWVKDIDGLLLPFQEGTCRTYLRTTPTYDQLVALSEALGAGKNVCSAALAPQETRTGALALDAHDTLLRPAAQRALECLIEASRREGVRPSGLLALARRYLPALKLLQPSDLAATDLSSLPGTVLDVLQSFAHANERRLTPGQCIQFDPQPHQLSGGLP